MKQFVTLLKYYFTLVLLFVIAKPCFVWAQEASVRGDITASDLFEAIWHGLPLDLATAGYATAPVWLMLGLALWFNIKGARTIYKVYAAVLSFLLSLIWVSDTCLYGFWGIKLDGTVWNYIDSPGGALSSVTAGYAMTVILAIILIGAAVFYLLRALFPKTLEVSPKRGIWTAVWIVSGGLIFLGIRGGVGKSTANVGMVYYSDNQFLNHTAVNPVFSIVASMEKTRNFADEFNFFEEDERRRIFSMLHYNTRSVDPDTLLTTQRPNVLIVLMEGCGGTFVHAVDSLSDPDITPNLNRLAAEGVVFTQCYANSFRTDRGTICTFSGYPSFPDLSVMKLPSKCSQLPSIAKTLKKSGYSTEFLYGGDINFTNTNGYLLATGYERTYGDTSFPKSVRKTHDWGVTDRITFDSLYHRVMRYPQNKPWHLGFLTLASHEPWKVPYDRIKGDKIANSMAYLDDCIGNFIARFKQTPQWKNTLIVFLPDHGIPYPEGITDIDERKSHIPIIWTGGAVRGHRRIEVLCNQTDLAATLLGQLGLPHDDFTLSRDVLSKTYTTPSAVHTWSEGIYYKDKSGISVVNLITQPASIFREAPTPSKHRTNAAKAFLQTCYDNL